MSLESKQASKHSLRVSRSETATRMKRSRRSDDDSEDENDDEKGDSGGEKIDGVESKEEAKERIERKRKREKRRRSELNDALDEMASLLFAIDPSLQTGPGKCMDAPSDAARSIISNRVDLVNCAVNMMRKIYSENEMRKAILAADLPKAGVSHYAGLRCPDTQTSSVGGSMSILHSSDLSRVRRMQLQQEADIGQANRRNAQQGELGRLQQLIERELRQDRNQLYSSIMYQSGVGGHSLSSRGDDLPHERMIGADTRAHLYPSQDRSSADTANLKQLRRLFAAGYPIDDRISIQTLLQQRQQLQHHHRNENSVSTLLSSAGRGGTVSSSSLMMETARPPMALDGSLLSTQGPLNQVQEVAIVDTNQQTS